MGALALLTILTLIMMASILWPLSRGAPWVPTSLGKVHDMLAMAEVTAGDLVYDLGCGDGRIIIAAARDFGARAVGIEIDPLRYLWCQGLITLLGLRGRVRIVYGDFFKQDLGPADVVTCYLTQGANERLQEKFVQELGPNTRLVSNDFTFPGLQLLGHDSATRIYLYRPALATES
jgi:SAM-dependent methyltransferase